VGAEVSWGFDIADAALHMKAQSVYVRSC